ncbi:uncharacterized protein LOC132185575 [Corylus avellana]|uniref:uncharacterized protein LOC132185575 n=1 Tax=Corylus avellana TaxID=13451 RepID=UPI001E21F604|nr:uncharacterized protein LOC132185575 [Corylus avellana]
MGTVILRSHDCFQGRLRHEALALTPPLKTRRNPNPNPTTRRKRSPAGIQTNLQDRDRRDRSVVARVAAKNLVMGQVKILKRGEKLGQTRNGCNSNKEEDLDLVLGSTDRLGPDPDTVKKQIKVAEFKVVDGIYAGSAFVTSPPPSSVPVPGFLGKKHGSATSDLRRLLRLDSV